MLKFLEWTKLIFVGLMARDSLDPEVPRHPYIFFPIDCAMFICESHDQLTGNVTFQDNLLHALLSR